MDVLEEELERRRRRRRSPERRCGLSSHLPKSSADRVRSRGDGMLGAPTVTELSITRGGVLAQLEHRDGAGRSNKSGSCWAACSPGAGHGLSSGSGRPYTV